MFFYPLVFKHGALSFLHIRLVPLPFEPLRLLEKKVYVKLFACSELEDESRDDLDSRNQNTEDQSGIPGHFSFFLATKDCFLLRENRGGKQKDGCKS